MKKKYYLIIALVIIFIVSVIIVKNYNTKKDLSKENPDIIELGDTEKPTIYTFDLRSFINKICDNENKCIQNPNDRYDYLKVAFAIQGLLNREKPTLYYLYEDNGYYDMDGFWKNVLFDKTNGDLKDYNIIDLLQTKYAKGIREEFEAVINLALDAKYKNDTRVINGVVLWDKSEPATANVASTIAGVDNLVPIGYDYTEKETNNRFYQMYITKLISGSRISKDLKNEIKYSTTSHKNDAYKWAMQTYLTPARENPASSKIIGYVRDSWTPACPKGGACFLEASIPPIMYAGQTQDITIKLLNKTGETWSGNTSIGPWPYNGTNSFTCSGSGCSLQLQDKDGNDDPKALRVYFNEKVKANETITIKFRITAPKDPSLYFLDLGVVNDGAGKWYDGHLKFRINVISEGTPVSKNDCNASTSKCYTRKYGSYELEEGGLFNLGLNNSDYLIQNKAFFFDLSPDNTIAPIDDRSQPIGTDVKTFNEILRQESINNKASVFSVSGFIPWHVKYSNSSDHLSTKPAENVEWESIYLISQYGGEVEADGMAPAGLTNASVFKYVKLKSELKQNNDKEDIKLNNVVREIYDKNTKYFMIYMGDYDGATWTSGILPKKFEKDTKNAKYPLLWPINSDLSNRIPHVYNWLYNNQTKNDYFVAGNNGSGYVSPARYGSLKTWKDHNNSIMKRFDLDATGFLLSPEDKITSNIQNVYAELTPILVGYHSSVGIDSNIVGKTPFIPVFNAIKNPVDEIKNCLQGKNEQCKNKQFFIFRTVQLSRSQAYEIIEKVQGKNVKVVDPYTMANLYNNKPTSYKGCYTNGKTAEWIENSTIPNGYDYIKGINSKSECQKYNSSLSKEPLSKSSLSSTSKNNDCDVDGNGVVNIKDYIQIRRHLSSISILKGNDLKRADVNKDGKVNAIDYILVRKKLLK